MSTIILAIIALVIGYKLYKVLGDTNYDHTSSSHRKMFEGDVEQVDGVVERENFVMQSAPSFNITAQTQQNLEVMAHHIGQYDSKLFMKNSLSAFEYIQELYANQQIEFLNKLASGAALERFTSRITELKQQGHQEVIAIIAVKDVELEEVHIANDHVLANVRFKTEQILYVKDTKAIEEEKMVVSGSQTKIVQYNELWTFSKKVNDESGTWMLVDFSK